MFIYDELELESNVLECRFENEYYFVRLDKTPFYPEGGGQLADRGSINQIEVLDVQKTSDGIFHKISEAVDGKVTCLVDREVRNKHSLFHSAQHLLSAVFERNGVKSGSIYMRDDHFVIDVYKAISREHLDQYEKDILNEIINSRPIYDRNYDAKIDVDVDVSYIDDDRIRLVVIEGMELNPCAGTHLSNTSEIKYIKIVKSKVIKDSTRLTVYPGDYGIDYVNRYFNNYNNLITMVKQPEEEVISLIEKKLKENKKMQKELKKIEKQLKND